MVSYSPYYTPPDPSSGNSTTGQPNVAGLQSETTALANPTMKNTTVPAAQLGSATLGNASNTNPASGLNAMMNNMATMRNYGSATPQAPTSASSIPGISSDDTAAYDEATDADMFGGDDGSGAGGGMGGMMGGMTNIQKGNAVMQLGGMVENSLNNMFKGENAIYQDAASHPFQYQDPVQSYTAPTLVRNTDY